MFCLKITQPSVHVKGKNGYVSEDPRGDLFQQSVNVAGNMVVYSICQGIFKQIFWFCLQGVGSTQALA